MDYSTDYYISKFSKIPEDRWCTHRFTIEGRFCALGHCGARNQYPLNPEAYFLHELFLKFKHHITFINDYLSPQYPQVTPKQRVLAALYDIKSLEALKEAQEIVNTEVPELVNP